MYSDLIVQHFGDPQFVGDLDDKNIEFEIGNPVCGDRIQVHAITNGATIENIVFRAWGCATSVATADIFCEQAKGQSLEQLESRSENDMAQMLGDLEPSQQHCVSIMVALHRRILAEASEKEVTHEL